MQAKALAEDEARLGRHDEASGALAYQHAPIGIAFRRAIQRQAFDLPQSCETLSWFE